VNLRNYAGGDNDYCYFDGSVSGHDITVNIMGGNYHFNKGAQGAEYYFVFTIFGIRQAI